MTSFVFRSTSHFHFQKLFASKLHPNRGFKNWQETNFSSRPQFMGIIYTNKKR